jgi:hypothetical protein
MQSWVMNKLQMLLQCVWQTTDNQISHVLKIIIHIYILTYNGTHNGQIEVGLLYLCTGEKYSVCMGN